VTFTLRPFQSEMIHDARQAFTHGAQSVLIQAPTGAGKTVIASAVLDAAAKKGKRSWFIVHRRELVGQAVRTFEEAGVPVGVVAAGSRLTPDKAVQVCSIGSLMRRIDLLPGPDFLCWDECHHCVSATWSAIHRRFASARHLGLTATPERLDGHGLRGHFETMVAGPSTRWLIEAGYLAPFRYFAAPRIALDAVGTVAGEFNRGQLAAELDKPSITGDAVSHYLRVAPGKRAVVFAVTRVHSRNIVDAFLAAGIPAAHVDGETPMRERDAAVTAFREGRIQVLSNVDLFGEGFDLPSLEVAILLRPTQSLALFLQQVGRALRTSPGKSEAIILDHASNVRMHGLPDDERVWSLDGREKRSVGAVVVRICPDCFAAIPAGRRTCDECGAEFPESEGKEIKAVEGELEEVDREALKRARKDEQRSAQTYEQLVALGRRRGYRGAEMWARHVLMARGRRHHRAG
jgi:DNA repair protein RadD